MTPKTRGAWRLRPLALAVAGLFLAPAARADLAGDLLITEIMPSSAATATKDWFELTNLGTTVLSLSGLKMDDSSFAFATSVAMSGIDEIAPGESVIFIESSSSGDKDAFRTKWGDSGRLLRIGMYSGSGVGLGGSGDGVIVYDASGNQLSKQSFGSATTGSSFVFSAEDTAAASAVVSTSGDIQGGFVSNGDTGSPGRTSGITTVPAQVVAAAASSVGETAFTANWSDASDETGYIVEVCAGAACDFTSLAQTKVVAADATSVTVSGLSGATTYRYRVRGLNTGGYGPHSAIQDVTTNAPVADTSPDAFSFTDQTGVTRGATVESNTITVAGINAAATIAVSGGEYRIGSGAYTSAGGTVGNGDTVTLRLTASASNNVQVSATLDIGGVTDSFSVTTAASGLLVSEVMSSSQDADAHAAVDWFELTNTTTGAIDLTGVKVIDNNASGCAASSAIVGLTSLAAGESVIVHTNTGYDAGTTRSYWGLPAGMGVYGLSAGYFGLGSGDAVRICDSGNNTIAYSGYSSHNAGVSRVFGTDGQTADVLSVLGSNGAWDPDSFGANEVAASPGYVPGSVADASLVPGTPTAAAASGIGQTGFTANWAAPASGATPTHYLVETASDANFTSQVRVRAIVEHPATSATLSGLASGTSYHYRVRAAHRGVLGGNSAVQQADTTAVTTVGDPPSFAAGPADGSAYGLTIGDTHDWVIADGIAFTVADTETAAASLALTATSNNQTVLPDANITIGAGAGGARTLKLNPVAVGYADVTLSLQDGDSNIATRTLKIAASSGATATAGTRWLRTRSDWSGVVAIDDDHMLALDDESPNLIALFKRNASGEPVTTYNIAAAGHNPLGLTSYDEETDLEGMTRIGNTLWATGSHGNTKGGLQAPNRERFFAMTIGGSGAATTLGGQNDGSTASAVAGYYKHLRTDLKAWDSANGHGLGTDYLGLAASGANSGKIPEAATKDGFSFEGLTSSPDDSALWFGFRAPLVAAPGAAAVTANSATGRTHALIVAVSNYATIVNGSGGTAGQASFGAPIRLDLGGRGIRDIKKNAAGDYLILAGPVDDATGTAPADFRLYSWNGDPASAPVERSASFAGFTAPQFGGSPEAIVAVPASLGDNSTIQIVSDTGGVAYYGDGRDAKDLGIAGLKKARIDSVVLGGRAGAAPAAADPSPPVSNTISAGNTTVAPTAGQTVTVAGGAPSGATITLPASGTVTLVLPASGNSQPTLGLSGASGGTVLALVASGGGYALQADSGQATVSNTGNAPVTLFLAGDGAEGAVIAAGAQVSFVVGGDGAQLRVLGGSVTVTVPQTGRTARAAAPDGNFAVLAGEVVSFDAAGGVTGIRLAVSGGVGDALGLPAGVSAAVLTPRIDAVAARLGVEPQVAAAQVLGARLLASQNASGVVAFELDGATILARPVGDLRIDPYALDGVDFADDGRASVRRDKVVMQFVPTVPDLAGLLAGLRAGDAQASLYAADNGALIALLNGQGFAVRPGWFAGADGAGGFATDGAGLLTWTDGGWRVRLLPAFADFALLREAVRVALPGAALAQRDDGAVDVTSGAATVRFQPRIGILPAPAESPAYWQDAGLWLLRLSGSTAQPFAIGD